jgi:hypothetical protein
LIAAPAGAPTNAMIEASMADPSDHLGKAAADIQIDNCKY